MNNIISLVGNSYHNDELLLDAYSKTITGVVGKVAGAVAHIQVDKKIRNRRSPPAAATHATGSRECPLELRNKTGSGMVDCLSHPGEDSIASGV